MREYLSEIIVTPESELVGKHIFESDRHHEFQVLEVLRNHDRFIPERRTVIRLHDILLVEGNIAELIKVKNTAGIEKKADVKVGLSDLESDEIRSPK